MTTPAQDAIDLSTSAVLADMNIDDLTQPLNPSYATSPSTLLQLNIDSEAPTASSMEVGSIGTMVVSAKEVKSHLWERCPVEVRDMIFDEIDKVDDDGVNYFRWRGSMPPLIVALRGLKNSYKQVLRRFAKANPERHLWMNSLGRSSIRDMNRVEVDMFEEVSLRLG